MELQLVSLEQAKKLKELGFDWFVNLNYFRNETMINKSVSDFNYNKDIDFTSAPPIALALKWFRDVKGVLNSVNISGQDANHYNIWYEYITPNSYEQSTPFLYYEECESALLDALIEYVEEQK